MYYSALSLECFVIEQKYANNFRRTEPSSVVSGIARGDFNDNNKLVIESFTNATAFGYYEFTYDGNDSSEANDFDGLGSLDFTDGFSDSIRFRVLSNSAPVRVGITMSNTNPASTTPSTDNNFATLIGEIGVVTSPTDFYFPYASFLNPSSSFTQPLDFTDIDWFTWWVQGRNKSGFTLEIDVVDTKFRPLLSPIPPFLPPSSTPTLGPPTLVPTPDTFGLFTLGMLILAVRLKNQKHSA